MFDGDGVAIGTFLDGHGVEGLNYLADGIIWSVDFWYGSWRAKDGVFVFASPDCSGTAYLWTPAPQWLHKVTDDPANAYVGTGGAVPVSVQSYRFGGVCQAGVPPDPTQGYPSFAKLSRPYAYRNLGPWPPLPTMPLTVAP